MIYSGHMTTIAYAFFFRISACLRIPEHPEKKAIDREMVHIYGMHAFVRFIL